MTVEKQTIQICGNVVFPLEVGRPAWISEDNGGYRITSNVQNFEQVSPTEIRFETRNTFYVLHLLSSTSKGLGRFRHEH